MSNSHTIYVLTDPRPGKHWCYIGQTNRKLSERLGAHRFAARSGAKTKVHVWLRELLSQNIEPVVKVLNEGLTHDAANKYEIKYIRIARKNFGRNCLNTTDGGSQGVGGPGLTGEKSPNAGLTNAQAMAVRAQYSQGVPASEISQRFGVLLPVLYDIINNIKYHNPKYTPPKRDRQYKLTWADVKTMRSRRLDGETGYAIAKDYPVVVTHVNAILRNAAWYDPDYTPPK